MIPVDVIEYKYLWTLTYGIEKRVNESHLRTRLPLPASLLLLSIIQPTKIDLSWQVFGISLTLKQNVPPIAVKINASIGKLLTV